MAKSVKEALRQYDAANERVAKAIEKYRVVGPTWMTPEEIMLVIGAGYAQEKR